MEYRPEIDGLRAVAVTSVVFFHAGFPVYGGYVGVDVFFVISGFLITSLILRAMGKESFSLTDFWVRRIRRIFPASLFMLGMVLVVGAAIMLPQEYEGLAKSAVAQCLFSGNIFFYRNTDYFAVASEYLPLLHTWSLAVEEQFYFVYPLLLMLLASLGPRKLFVCLLVLGIGSFALCVFTTARYPDAAFYLLPSRAWELLAGGILATWPTKIKLSPTSKELFSWIGIGLIFYSVYFFNSDTVFPGISAMVPVLGTVLIILGNTHGLTSIGRVLALKPVVFVGLISYSWYLWHWPIMAFMRNALFGFDHTAGTIAIVVSFIAAVLSWKFIETPFRHSSPAQKPRQVFMVAALSSFLLLLSTGIIIYMNGLPNRFSERTRQFIASSDIPTNLQTNHERREDFKLPRLGKPTSTSTEPDFLLWGDSHALFVGPVLEDLAEEFGVYGYVAARSATAPILGAWTEATEPHATRWNECVLEFIERHNIKNVILAARWTSYLEPNRDGGERRGLIDLESPIPSVENATLVLERGLKRTVEELRKRNVRVWIAQEVPLQDCDVPRAVAVHAEWKIGEPRSISDVWYGVTLEQHQSRHQRFDELLAKIDHITLLDSTSHCFGSNRRSLIAAQGNSLYNDDDHLSSAGARYLLTDTFRQFFVDITSKSQLATVETSR